MGFKKILSFLGVAKKPAAELGGMQRWLLRHEALQAQKNAIAKRISIFNK